jgi:type II secretory ATPase GspE/PulE/Tfp pilus assembly ATPase PilB-like protein
MDMSASVTGDAAFGPTAGSVSSIHWRGSNTPLRFVKGKGCPTCMNTGFYGRIGIFEFLVPNDAIREAIESGASAGTIRELARKSGMRTLREAGIDRIVSGLTSPEEILRVTAT